MKTTHRIISLFSLILGFCVLYLHASATVLKKRKIKQVKAYNYVKQTPVSQRPGMNNKQVSSGLAWRVNRSSECIPCCKHVHMLSTTVKGLMFACRGIQSQRIPEQIFDDKTDGGEKILCIKITRKPGQGLSIILHEYMFG